MRAARLLAPEELQIEDVPDPSPLPSQVLIRVYACGVCGTDLHTYAGANPLARYPLTPGHEFSGIVEGVGCDVSRFAPGDRVVVDPSYFCGSCPQCRAGWPNLCPFKGGHGSAKPGGFAELVVADHTSCEPVPTGLDLAVASLAEPLSCVLHGVDRLGPVLGERVLVYGAGTIGLMTAGLLRLAGASSVSVVDVKTDKLALAQTFGATNAASSVEELGADIDGDWHVVVDATGALPAIEDALTRVRKAGRVLLLGVAKPGATVPIEPFRVNWHELTIIGSMAVRHSFGRAVDLLDQHNLPFEKLITDMYPLANLAAALEQVRSGTSVKVQVRP